MFSDFAVKSLLMNWNEDLFGKNPFIKIGEMSKKFILNFEPETLINCQSPQIQLVGKLCENGSCEIHLMSGTIVFGVDKEKIDNSAYDLEILTLVTNVNEIIKKNNFDFQKNEKNESQEGEEDYSIKNSFNFPK